MNSQLQSEAARPAITLDEIMVDSIDTISSQLTATDWSLAESLDQAFAAAVAELKGDHDQLSVAVRLCLASYYLSFLLLFFRKTGEYAVDTIKADEELTALLAAIAGQLSSHCPHYRPTGSTSLDPFVFLDRWLSSSALLSAQRAKDNPILDLLIVFDQHSGSSLSSRLTNDIRYLVYSLAMLDERISWPEQQLLDLLESEAKRARRAIGDERDFNPAAYAEELTERNRAKLLAQAQAELDELIGLGAIKEEIRKLEAFLAVRAMRQQVGLAVADLTLHFVFKGNPGTGKTTVARILGKLFHGLGHLDRGHVVETDRGGLVAEYLGQTAGKTRKVCDSAKGGILFVDEAYALSRGAGGGSDNFGREALETLLKFMEDNRRELVVAVAGYPGLMDDFIATNPGLRSRFTRYLDFADFSADELLAISELFARKAQYEFSAPARTRLNSIFQAAADNRGEGFGNARYVRNLFEETVQNQAMRLAARENRPTREELVTIEEQDLPGHSPADDTAAHGPATSR